MFIHYVYALYYKGVPFYIGISCNPAERIYKHKSDGGGHPMGRFMAKIKSVSDIQIRILDKIRTNSVRKNVDCHKLEQRWVSHYKSKGFILSNKLQTFYSS